jgi:hypothetical protein
MIFVEHGPVTGNQDCSLATLVEPYWKRISGGCHLNRKTDDLIRTGIPNRCRRNRLSERAETLDVYVPGFGNDLIELSCD